VPEAYGFDSPTLMGYLAAKTETVEIGSAILNIYSRTPSAILQTAAGLDNVAAAGRSSASAPADRR
jgi:alkanesulfonate monooxygenase SsuD/methylene tetrahydromethanopterin reductase-like flavin-dependent oxidoreductase (luciferase family)